MAGKRALIVDDSKSARVFLARILEKYQIEVDMAESAEQAIEYLGTHLPDVIFMDHLMPGMDGFQAVQAIKNDPRTAMIPIMMYTSQEGELYLGQARALGAVGVLPKQIKPADVSKVLYQLHLVPDRRSAEQTSFRQVTMGALEGGGEPEAAPPARPLTDASLREHVAELRRALVASLDSQADRITADVRAMLYEMQTPSPEPAAPERRPRPWGWIAAGTALLLAVAAGGLWLRELGARQALAAEVASLREALAAATATSQAQEPAGAAAAADETAQALAAEPAYADDVAATGVAEPSDASGESPQGAGPPAGIAPVVMAVPYGAEPLGGPRLEAIRQYLDRLVAEGYRGTVEIRIFPGRFCLVGNAVEGYSMAPEEMLFTRCDLVGNPHEEAAAAAQRVPLAFANLAGAFRGSTGGAADVQVVTGDAVVTVMDYPRISDALTAGEWNRAAGANNRIEIRAR